MGRTSDPQCSHLRRLCEGVAMKYTLWDMIVELTTGSLPKKTQARLDHTNEFFKYYARIAEAQNAGVVIKYRKH